MKILAAIMLILSTAFVVLLDLNPNGLGQRFFYGMTPPYHWEKVGNDDFVYVGANQKVCAKVYKSFGEDTDYWPPRKTGAWVAYGNGFSKHHLIDEQQARQLAEQECR